MASSVTNPLHLAGRAGDLPRWAPADAVVAAPPKRPLAKAGVQAHLAAAASKAAGLSKPVLLTIALVLAVVLGVAIGVGVSSKASSSEAAAAASDASGGVIAVVATASPRAVFQPFSLAGGAPGALASDAAAPVAASAAAPVAASAAAPVAASAAAPVAASAAAPVAASAAAPVAASAAAVSPSSSVSPWPTSSPAATRSTAATTTPSASLLVSPTSSPAATRSTAATTTPSASLLVSPTSSPSRTRAAAVASPAAVAASAAPPVAGVVTTLAGTLSSPGYAESSSSTGARFFYPYGVATGPAGTVFVADSANHVLRTVSTATGATALYAGKPSQSGSSDGDRFTAAKFYYPNRIAVETLATGGTQLYVGDTQNHLIRAVSADGTVRTVAGQARVAGHADGTGSAVLFNYPYSVCVDSAGNVYVADSANHVIRKVTPAGVTTTFAGGIQTAGSANGQGTAARFATPTGISRDATGRFFIADVDNNAIRSMTATGLVSTLAGAPGVRGAAIDGLGSAARFYRPFAVAAAPNGDAYVADAGNSLIRRVTPAGAVTTVGGQAGVHGYSDTPGATLFDHPYDLAVDQVTGRVYVCDTHSTLIRVIS